MHLTGDGFGDIKSVVRPSGPGPAAGGVTALLEDEANVKVTVNDSSNSSTSQPSTSKNIPLAIVGMGGRLPIAANHDERWKFLAKGLYCYQLVSNAQYPAWNPPFSDISRYI